jgi:hypothetical protein
MRLNNCYPQNVVQFEWLLPETSKANKNEILITPTPTDPMEFEDPTVGELARKRFFESPLGKSLCLRHLDVLPHYTEIGRFKRVLQKSGKNSRLQVVRSQIPLTSANAMTIHKSQVCAANLII